MEQKKSPKMTLIPVFFIRTVYQTINENTECPINCAQQIIFNESVDREPISDLDRGKSYNCGIKPKTFNPNGYCLSYSTKVTYLAGYKRKEVRKVFFFSLHNRYGLPGSSDPEL